MMFVFVTVHCTVVSLENLALGINYSNYLLIMIGCQCQV